MVRVAGAEPIYEAAELFRRRVLIDGTSFLWPEHHAWTDGNIQTAIDALQQSPQQGNSGFYASMASQLETANDDVIRIVADAMAIFVLFFRSSSYGSGRKWESVNSVLHLRRESLQLPAASRSMLDAAFAVGVAESSTAFQSWRGQHLTFLVAFVMAVRRQGTVPSDAEAVRAVAQSVMADQGTTTALRPATLHLLFPDRFEEVVNGTDRTAILSVFSDQAGLATNSDDQLHEIRLWLENDLDRPSVSLLDSDVVQRWNPQKDAQVWRADPGNARKVAEKNASDSTVRRLALRVFADAIESANAVSSASWSTTVNPSYVSLNVGPSTVVSINADHLAVCVDLDDLDTDKLQRLHDHASHFDMEELFSKAIPSFRWVRILYDQLQTVVDIIGPSTVACARQFAAKVQTQGTFWFSHASGMVKYLNEELDLLIPQPTYLNSQAGISTRRFWKISPGGGATLWDQFRQRNLIAVLWAEVANLNSLLGDSRTSFRKALSEIPEVAAAGQVSLTHTAKQLWYFGHEMQIGDRVLAYGQGQILGWGQISSDYRYVPEDPSFPHQRHVTWESVTSIDAVTIASEVAVKLRRVTTIIELTTEEFEEATNPNDTSKLTPPTLADLECETFMDVPDLEDLIDLLHDKKQLILEGPPGSGKTWLADKLARYLTENQFTGNPDERVELVQFHQSYGYEDFVQGIRPITDTEGKLTYRVVPGIFTRLCRTAASNPDKPFVLIIDEINRGNLSRIFGELLLLLEYRDKRVRLPYGSEGSSEAEAFLSIPPNLYVIGTMNSTDRSLALIDYALRRRFYFHRLLPMANGQAPVLARWLERQAHIEPARATQIGGLFIALNTQISQHLTPDFQIGHSYFMRPDIGTESGLRRVWDRAIRPLLEEYFHGTRSGDQTLDGFRLEVLLPSLASSPLTEPIEGPIA